MEENALLNYDAFDGFKRPANVDEIVRIVLDEQKHSLTEEDRRILQDRENLRNEFHTLQNVDLCNASLSQAERGSPLWCDLAYTEPSTSTQSDVYFVDVEAIEQPSLPAENESSNTELDNTIANFIQDENVKSQVLRLNQQIRVNASSIRSFHDEARNLMIEKLKLKRKLASIERKIVNFSSAEVRVQRIKRRKGVDSADTGHQKRTYFYRFGAPYFKTRDRFPADRNPDLSEIVRTDQLMNIRLPRIRRILSHDAVYLELSILKQLKAKRVEQLRKCLKDADDRLKCDPANAALADEIRCIVRTIKETEEITRISATKDWNIPVDFMSLTYSPRFSSDDYERIWRLTGSPKLTRGDFSEQEIAELRSLAQKYNEQDWDRIASEMSTNRSGFMCFTKYVTIQKKGKNKPWTKEENELLHNLCISMDSISKSDSRFQFWKNIRCHFPHRSYTQIHSHWTYVLEPRLKKGRFTPDECKLMQKMLDRGKSYKDIALTMRNRSIVQVRTHLEVLLQNESSRGNWTPEEEEKLLQLIEKYGTHDWVTISKEMGTRNRSQCRLKYVVYLKNNQRFSVGNRAPKEFWTEEENQLFKELVFKYGPNFTKLSEEMPTKSREQLRHKYHRTKHKAEFQEMENMLNDDKSAKNPWTDEELEQFKQLLVTYGVQYKTIAEYMPTKTIHQLRYKYYAMKNEWNLSLPSVKKSVDRKDGCNDAYKRILCNISTSVPSVSVSAPSSISASSISISAQSACVSPPSTSVSASFTSIPAPSASVPVTYIAEPPKSLLLPEELFENSVPISGADNTSVSFSTDESPALPSDPLFRSEKELAAPLSKSIRRKSLKLSSSYWIPVELEHFKRLLMVHGPDYKKISSIMQKKSPKQLRWKYHNMKKKWDLSAFPKPAAKAAPKERKTCAVAEAAYRKISCAKPKQSPQRQAERAYDNLTAIIFEVSRAPSTPPHSPDVPVEEEAPGGAPDKRRPSKSSSLKAVWTDDDLKRFKELLMEYGPQCKKISEIMTGKTVSQLRYKYNCLKNAGEIPAPAKTNAKRAKSSATSVPVSLHSSQSLFVASEDHSLFSNSSSMFAGFEEGFAGFPDESQSPLSFRDLIPLRRIETFERVELPGSSYEQMIVPERISEVNARDELCEGGSDRSSVNLNESVEAVSSQMEGESASGTSVEVKREIVADEIKEEDRRDEFST